MQNKYPNERRILEIIRRISADTTERFLKLKDQTKNAKYESYEFKRAVIAHNKW